MNMKKIISLILALIMCLCLSVSAFAVVDASDEFYVADYANVLSSTTKQSIIDYNGSLEYQCDGAQIVVVTIPYLSDGLDSEEYATKLFNNWGVGSSSANNGMLLLLVTEEKRGWLKYGAGLSSSIDGDDVDEMLEDYFWPDVDKGKYDSAVSKLFNVLLKWYDNKYDASILSSGETSDGYDTYYDGTYSSYDYNDGYYSGFSVFVRKLIGFFVLLFIISLFTGGRRRGYRDYDSYRSSRSSIWPWVFLYGASRNNRRRYDHWDDYRGPRGPQGPGPGGFGGGRGFGGGGHSSGFGGSSHGGGGFGGGMGHGGGGHGGGGGGRR